MRNNANLLEEKEIKIENLLLDPNNPRFSNQNNKVPLEKIADNDVQEWAYEQMNARKNHFEIEELIDAIMTDGFLHVDKIFVEKINSKYLVVEGNRRITAIKKILNTKEDLDREIYNQITKIPCIILDSENPDAKRLKAKILGLRHHGSIMSWKPLPQSCNLYQEYMMELCAEDEDKASNPNNFIYDPSITDKIASKFSVKRNDVMKKVKLYRTYLQLLEESYNNLEERSFSMLQETLGKKELKKYFEYDEKKCIFSAEGVEEILDLYFGFGEKDAVITEASAGSSTVRDFAKVISSPVVTEGDIRRITEYREKASAVYADVTSRLNERTLRSALEKILEEVNKIKIGEIESDGFAPNEKENLEKIEEKLKQLKRAAGMESI